MRIISSTLLIALLSTLRGYAIEVDAETFAKDTFDFIVVGAGTSGTALAVRLSEIPSFRVGLIEAGNRHKDDPKLLIPRGYTAFGTWGDPEYDWGFSTTPQKNLAGRSLDMVRGKGVGGCSQINDMGYLRAGSVEYDLWGQLGNPGWSWASTLHYLRKAENNSVVPEDLQRMTFATVESRYRGHSGPIRTSFSKWYSAAILPFYYAMESLGLKPRQDVGDGTDSEWIGNPVLSIDLETQTRSYAGNGYFEPHADRPNLVLLTAAQVTRIVLSDKTDKHGDLRANGVEFMDLKTGHKYTARSSREVILSAGAVQSPQLLELSGIGNKTRLEHLGIKSRIDNPFVGENYQDHLHAQQMIKVPSTLVTWDVLSNPTANATQLAEYKANLTGIYTAGINTMAYASANKFVSASEMAQWRKASDKEFYATNPSPGARLLYEINMSRLTPDSNQASLEVYAAPANAFPDIQVPDTSYLQLAAIPQHPFSRGWIHINSSNALEPPVIDVNTFGLSIDRKIMLAASKFVRSIVETRDFKPFIEKYLVPSQSEPTDAQWMDFIEQRTAIPFHPCCTAAMLPRDLDGVVDPKMIVYGTSNLRVVDISVMPFMIASHLMGTAYVIGEKAADIIKDEYRVHTEDSEVVPQVPLDAMDAIHSVREQASQTMTSARKRAEGQYISVGDKVSRSQAEL